MKAGLCGPKEIRTPDLLFAKEARYQLRYGPKYCGYAWTRTRDLVIISDAL